MRNSKEELDALRQHILKLDAAYRKELANEAARSTAGRSRHLEDGEAWEAVIGSMKLDLSKILEHDKADAAKAEATLKELEARLKIVPPEVLSYTQDHLRLDDLSAGVLSLDPGGPRWFKFPYPYDGGGEVHKYPGDGVTEGDSGFVGVGVGWPPLNPMYPRSNAVGSGRGWTDSNSVGTRCWLWWGMSGAYITNPGTVYVWPYLDIHGYLWVRANDGFFSSKAASVALTVETRVYNMDYQYKGWFTWHVRDLGNDNIDVEGRVDYTGYSNYAGGGLQVAPVPGEDLYVQVIVELQSLARGSGSHALLDFHTGDNGIRIPHIMLGVP